MATKQESKMQSTGHFKDPKNGKKEEKDNLDTMLKARRDEQNRIYNKDGTIDARAFKRIIFERQAGSMTGPKNFLAAQVNSANKSEFLEDNILLHGLKSFGITIDELLEANLKNLDPNAYKPIEPRFKDQDEFVVNVQKNLQSPVVRSLKSIVDIIKPTGYGINKITRHRSVPQNRSKHALGAANGSAASFAPGTSVNGAQRQNSRLLETVSEENAGGVEPSQLSMRRSQTQNEREGATTQADGGDGNNFSGLQSVPEQYEQENEHVKRSLKGLGLHSKNYSVPKLDLGGAGALSRHKMSDMKGSHAQSSRVPLMSQMAIHNRSSEMKDDNSLAQQILGLQEELDQQISNEHTQSDRYVNKTPFKHVQSNYQIAPQGSLMFIIPEPKNLDPEVAKEDYHDVYMQIARKYSRRDRYGKVITTDPAELNRLNDRGYKIKAERYQRKRALKKAFKRQRSVLTGEAVAVRGDRGYESSTSSSASSHSSVSYGGVPEADLEHLVNLEKQEEINKRRNQRRADKWQVIFDSVVSEGVKNEISGAVISQQATYEGSDASPVRLPSQIQPLSDDQSDASPGTQRRQFAESQAQMKGIMDTMAARLKNRFLEEIDEEVPEEYLIQKEQESIQNATGTSFTKNTSASYHVDPLEQIEQSIQTMMEGLVGEIRENGTLEERNQAEQTLERQAQTKPSIISNQASYISSRRDLSQRMGKFQRTVNTSPRFYDNHLEDNAWKVKMKNLDDGRIQQIFPNNKRMESLQKFAQHLRSKNLIPQDVMGDLPKGFNNKLPLDMIMRHVGSHMHRRTQDLRDQKSQSQSISFNQTSRKQSEQPEQAIVQNLNAMSSSQFPKSPSLASYGINNFPGGSPSTTNFHKRNSDQLMQDVNAVFQFLARTGNNTNSLKSLNQALADQTNELNECIIVEKQVTSKRQSSHHRQNSQQILPGMDKKPPICHCNHMAPHRHFYMSPSRSTKNFLGSQELPNSQLIASDDHIELVDHHQLQTAHMASGVTGEDIVHPGTSGEYAQKELGGPILAQHYPRSKDTQHHTGSSQGQISPLGIQKAPMTDRNWNNSELKKFSVTQSKSNADIAEELRRFKMENGALDSFNHAQNSGDGMIITQHTQIAHDTEEEDPKLNTNSQFGTGSRKGKTFTVLFKAERNKNENSNAHLRSNLQLESPGLMREVSKDEYLRPGMVEKPRYEDKNNSGDKKKKSPAVLHKINILQNLNNNSGDIHSPYVRTSAARQQLLSVSVKNIELPDQYKVSDQQKPLHHKISEVATPVSTKICASPSKQAQHRLHEVGLQTNLQQKQTPNQNLTQHSFFNAKSAQQPIDVERPQVVVIQSQMEKYPAEILNSQPTIGTESQDKLHGLQGPAPKYVGGTAADVSNTKEPTSNENTKRDGTRLLIMSDNTERSMKNIEEERQRSPQNRNSPPKQVVELGKLDKQGSSSPSGLKLQQTSNNTLLGRDRINQLSGGQMLTPAPPTINVLDVFNIKGQPKNLQARGQQPMASNNQHQSKHEIELGKSQAVHDEVTATQGALSQFEIPRPIYQQDQLGSQMDQETDGTAYGSRGDREMNNIIGKAAMRDQQNLSAMMRAYPKTNLDLQAVQDPRTDRVVRNFKPSKTKKLPEMLRTMEKKLSQLADSNVTPLGLFNQDLHAQREWNKLMAQKNFSSTLNDKNMSFKDAMIHEILMPLSPPAEANKTSQALPAHVAEKNRNEEETFTEDNSLVRPSHDKTHDGDNSTLQSPDSRSGAYKKLYEQPRIQVFNDTQQKNMNPPKSPRKTLQAKVPLARQNGKVIVFNFKGNSDLPEEIIKRVELEQQNQAMARMPHQGSKPLLLSNSPSRNHLGGGSSNVFSTKRHSSVNPQDSVSIYKQAKAAMGGQEPNIHIPGTTKNGIPKQNSVSDVVLKEERNRYRTTVRKRMNASGVSNEQKQPTSLSTSKFLVGRRNPTINAQMYSQKVSPFKPMGGGFKQNLNIEVSPQRMEQEVATQREKMMHNSAANVFNQPARGSFRHVSDRTLELTLTENQNHEPVGFSIEKAVMTQKPHVRADVKDLIAEDCMDLSSKTKEKIGKSALSRLDQQLGNFKANSDGGSSEGPHGSGGITPNTRIADNSEMMQKLRSQHQNSNEDLGRSPSKSSTDYHPVGHIIAPTANNTIQNFAVPKLALIPKPVQEMIQTNDSFSKIINESPLKRKSPKLTNNTKTTFARKKESTSVPYPIKSGTIGENLKGISSFNISGQFQGLPHHGPGETRSILGGRNSGQFSNSHGRSSPKLEGTRMKLTQKSKDNRSSPFEKEPDSPRKRLSPKTMAMIKGGSPEYPIKMEKEQKLKELQHVTSSGVESRMRSDSQGMSMANPGSQSRPELVTQAASLSKDDGPATTHLIEREYSQDDILNSTESKQQRTIVGLIKGMTGSEPNSSMHIVGSRDEFELTSKVPSNMILSKLDDIHMKMQNLDNNMVKIPQKELSSDQALLDNPGELGNLYQMHVDAQRHIESLVSQPPLMPMERPTKNHYIQKVAQLQMGAQNYRKKGKRQKDGLNPGFEFQNNNTQDALSRVLGRNNSKNNRNIMTLNLNPMKESKNESSMIYDSRGTDVLLNMSTQNRDFALSVSNNALLKKRQQ